MEIPEYSGVCVLVVTSRSEEAGGQERMFYVISIKLRGRLLRQQSFLRARVKVEKNVEAEKLETPFKVSLQ